MEEILAMLKSILNKNSTLACIFLYAIVVFSLVSRYAINLILKKTTFKIKHIFVLLFWFIFFFINNDSLEEII